MHPSSSCFYMFVREGECLLEEQLYFVLFCRFSSYFFLRPSGVEVWEKKKKHLEVSSNKLRVQVLEHVVNRKDKFGNNDK